MALRILAVYIQRYCLLLCCGFLTVSINFMFYHCCVSLTCYNPYTTGEFILFIFHT